MNTNESPSLESPEQNKLERKQRRAWTERYIDLLVDHKRILFAVSVVLILLGGYFGKDAFSGLQDGGFSPPFAESATGMSLMNKYLNYPEYTIAIQVKGTNGLIASSTEFESYYKQIQQNLHTAHAPVGGIVGYYDYPYQTRMISDDQTEVMLYANIHGTISNDGLQKIVSITPLRTFIGGTYPMSNELNTEILSGVETAEFGSLPVIVVLLMLALGGVIAGLLPFYVALMGIFWTLSFLLAFNDAFRISGIAASIVTMFGLGLAIDYSLFIVSRFRNLREQNPQADVKSLLQETFQTAGKTVMISATTVFVALVGGLFFQEFFLASICLAVMLAAALSAIAANSFLYCLLSWLDHRVLEYSIPLWYYQIPRQAVTYCFPLLPSVERRNSRKVNAVTVEMKADNLYDRIVPIEGDAPIDEDIEQANEERKVNDSAEFNYAVVEEQKTDNFANPGETPIAKDVDPADHERKVLASTAVAASSSEVDEDESGKFWFALGDFVLRHPWIIIFACFSFLIGLSSYFLVVAKWGNTDADVLPIVSSVRKVYDDLRTDFHLYGRSNHYVYLQTKPEYTVSSSSFLQAIESFQTAAIDEIGAALITNIYSMINIGNVNFTFNDYVEMYSNPTSSQYANYTKALVYPLAVTNLQNATYIQFSTTCHQYDESCKHIVRQLRSLLQSSNYFYDESSGENMLVERLVTGDPAMNLDLYESLGSNIPAWISIQMIAIFFILMFMTRSVVLPLKAVVLSILSLGATFGLIQLLFQSTYGPTDHDLGFVPTGYFSGSNIIFIFSVAFGLSVDYEVFLLSRLLENYARTKDVDLSVKRALQQTGGIITSAAILLAITTFAFIGCEVYFIKMIGVGISIAVVLDSTIIRMLLVPAIIKVLGSYNFYVPEWLGKVIDWVGLYDMNHVSILHDSSKMMGSISTPSDLPASSFPPVAAANEKDDITAV